MAESFIHRFVAGAKEASVLLLLHGTGGTENDLLEMGGSLLPGASLLSPRGKILERGMPRFFRRHAEGIFDEEDLIFRTHELADFINAALFEYGLVGKPIIALGYSNGANIAASLLLLRPEILSGAVLLRAMVPLVPSTLPKLSDAPVFIASGRNDPIIPPENPRRLEDLLTSAGASVQLHWTEGGHELHSEEIEAARNWLMEYFPNN